MKTFGQFIEKLLGKGCKKDYPPFKPQNECSCQTKIKKKVWYYNVYDGREYEEDEDGNWILMDPAEEELPRIGRFLKYSRREADLLSDVGRIGVLRIERDEQNKLQFFKEEV